MQRTSPQCGTDSGNALRQSEQTLSAESTHDRTTASACLPVCRSDVSAVPLARPSTRTVHRRTLLPMEREEGRTPIEMLGYQ